MDKLYIIIPAYNESQNICEVMNEWYEIIENQNKESRLVIIDDGSTDTTYETARQYAKRHPKLIVLKKKNAGHGPAVLYGYRYALKHHADWIFQTDSDGQTFASEFWRFWNLRNRYDAVLGMRIKRGDGFHRKMIEDILRLIVLIIFRVRVSDANAPFRLIKTSVLAKYIDAVPKDYNLPNAVFTALLCKYEKNIIFKEITFRSRQGGKNSMNIRKIFKTGCMAILDFIKINADYTAGKGKYKSVKGKC